MSSGSSSTSLVKLRDRLVVPVEIGKVQAALHLGDALQRRIRRDAAIEVDRLFGVVLLLGNCGQLQQHDVAVGLQRPRKLQIEPARRLAAAAVERRAEVEQHFARRRRSGRRPGGEIGLPASICLRSIGERQRGRPRTRRPCRARPAPRPSRPCGPGSRHRIRRRAARSRARRRRPRRCRARPGRLRRPRRRARPARRSARDGR